jgi:uncharacterized protein with PIN domain
MGSVLIRFYAELNDFLVPSHRGITFAQEFHQNPAIKDLIESLGVPHTEVDLILIEGKSVDFGCPVHDGDRISVYPVFESIDLSSILKVRPRPLREIRFILDIHLGKLAAMLRLLGFDTLYRNDYTDPDLAEISQKESRILLTKDRGLLKRSQVTHGYCIRDHIPRGQIEEVLNRFDLTQVTKPFTRCLSCNGMAKTVDKNEINKFVPDRIQERFASYSICDSCGKIYWEGSHYNKLKKLIEELGVRSR